MVLLSQAGYFRQQEIRQWLLNRQCRLDVSIPLDMNNKEVALAFATRKTTGKSNNMFIEGDSIYSYGKHYRLAKWNGNEVLLNQTPSSQTTGHHRGLVRKMLTLLNVNIVYVDSL